MLLLPMYNLTSCVAQACIMIGLYLAGEAVKKSGVPAGRKVIKAGKRCVGVAIRGVCLPFSVPVACVRTFGNTAGSLATYGLDVASNVVSEVPVIGEVRISLQRSQCSSSTGHLHVFEFELAYV